MNERNENRAKGWVMAISFSLAAYAFVWVLGCAIYAVLQSLGG